MCLFIYRERESQRERDIAIDKGTLPRERPRELAPTRGGLLRNGRSAEFSTPGSSGRNSRNAPGSKFVDFPVFGEKSAV